MKKLQLTKKEYLINFSKKKHKKELKRKKIRKIKRIAEINLKVRKKRSDSYKTIYAPENFSFIGNTNDIIAYFKQNLEIRKRGYGTMFHLGEVNSLTFDAVALLMATIKDPDFRHSSNGDIRGTEPKQENLQRLFKSTGFNKYVNSSSREGEIHTGDMLHYVYEQKASSEVVDKVLEALKKCGSLKNDFIKVLYSPIFEIISNTHEHSGSKKQKYDWWVFYNLNEIENTLEVCILDLGIGILGSLDKAGIHQKRGWIWRRNNNYLQKMLNGDETITTSRTRRKERGLGLKGLNDFLRDNKYTEKSILITNNVLVDIKNGKFKNIKEDFSGTFYYLSIKI